MHKIRAASAAIFDVLKRRERKNPLQSPTRSSCPLFIAFLRNCLQVIVPLLLTRRNPIAIQRLYGCMARASLTD
jgi:hypothetical protein